MSQTATPLETLRRLISAGEPFPTLRRLLSGAARLISVEEVAPEAKSLFAACLAAGEQTPVAIIAYSEEEAERLHEGLIAFGLPPERTLLIPSMEGILFEDGAPDWSALGNRMRGLTHLALHRSCVAVMPLSAALVRTCPRAQFAAAVREVSTGDRLDLHRTAADLAARGYRREDLVTEVGEFSVRGGLLDVWPPVSASPVRIELFGDEVESIRSFEVESQRSTTHLKSVMLPPAREVIPGESGERAADILQAHLDEQVEALRAQGRSADADALELRVSEHLSAIRQGTAFNGMEYYLPFLVSGEQCLLDWLPADALIIWDEPALCRSGWERLQEELAEVHAARVTRGQALALDREHHVPFERARERILERRCVAVSSLPHQSSWQQTPHRLSFPSAAMDSFGSQAGVFAENVKTWIGHGCSVVVVTPNVLRIGQMLRELGVRPVRGELRTEFEPGAYVLEGDLPHGFQLPEQKVLVVAEADIFGARSPRRPRFTRRDTRPIHSIVDIKEGDYIVHVHHGIGVYRGLRQMETASGVRDFLLLEYAGGDKLYVPADQMDRIQRYSGADSGPPTIHRLGGSDWARTKKKVKASVREMAKELLQIYAAREALGGTAYPPDSPWQAEMEQAFPYTETPDQLRAIEEVKRDLEQPKPMDRLVCGDVGFGKTEVAIRAAFKVVLEGKQVCVLCPTTVLAQQHYNVFSERLAAFPVKVEMLSRFRSPREQRAILDDLRAGNVDIIIGTHRLLSKDVQFHDLGLVVVDEEQRFGVAHKERLKQLRVSVDVLTLTATPIPRTLHMSLAGIRDMSVINQAPEGRMPVRTYVREADDALIREAIVRELDRNGQVYFVHNRVESIDDVARRVSQLVPYARIAVAHGQMDEHDLESVMMAFYEHRYDVLVCTTIIESGLDVPNVNTIIINNADKLGLSQLYQLRGRVGRSNRQAYAYLLYRSEEILSEEAQKRLAAMREFADLGSGFKVALRDLEIRGAGNLLGAEQHGQMISVGFDMYCHLLAQAVREIQGKGAMDEDEEEQTLPPVELPVEAYIPESYIPTEAMRIAIYRKLAAQRSEEEVSRLEEELDDRFGPPPAPVLNALTILRLRLRARDLGIRSVTEEDGRIALTLEPGAAIPPDALKTLKKAFPQHWWEATRVRLAMDGTPPLELVSETLRLLARSISRSSRREKAAAAR
jgi:transcription-repair coupling factor (superfamily II helicase)